MGVAGRPFFIVNPKAYLTGQALLELALLADELAGQFAVNLFFTAQHVDLRLVAQATTNLIVTAQHMDPISGGRGMGKISPEGLADSGAKAVFLNHTENPLTLADLDAAIQRAAALGLATLVCADNERQCRAVAELGPTIVVCEPTSTIGTRAMDQGDYAELTTSAVRSVNSSVLVAQAGGVASAADVRRVMRLGADGSGGTSLIVNAPDRRALLTELLAALVETSGS